MCSRYNIGKNVRRWLARYGWNQSLSVGDVRPQDCAPVLSARSKNLLVVPMRWGMKNPKTGALVIHMPVMVREEDIDAWLLDANRTKDLLESEVPLERIQAVEEFSLFS